MGRQMTGRREPESKPCFGGDWLIVPSFICLIARACFLGRYPGQLGHVWPSQSLHSMALGRMFMSMSE